MPGSARATPTRSSVSRPDAWVATQPSASVRLMKPGPLTSTRSQMPATSRCATIWSAACRGGTPRLLPSGSATFAWKSANCEGRMSGSAPAWLAPNAATTAALTRSASTSWGSAMPSAYRWRRARPSLGTAQEVAAPAGAEPFLDFLGDRGPLKVEQRRTAVRLHVRAPGQFVQATALEQRAEPRRGGTGQRGPRLLRDEGSRPLQHLQRDVAGEAVGHDHVRLPGEQVATLHVADEADRQSPVRWCVGEQLVGAPGQPVSLSRLGADREQADPGRRDAVPDLRISHPELRESDQHLRLRVLDGTGVHQQRGRGPGGQDHRETGPHHPRQ